jgi:hypothetical protein
MAFRAAQIGAHAFEFLAALIAYIIMWFHAAFKFYPERIAYTAHITSLFLQA